MFKKSLLAVALVFAAASANAAYTTEAQTNTYSGAAGSKSTEEGVDPFSFSKFDSSLGVLTGVVFTYNFSVSDGYIGASNQSNQTAGGSAELGSHVSFDFSDVSQYIMLAPITLSQSTSFYLQPAGSEAGDDSFMLDGKSMNSSKDRTLTENFILSSFIGDDPFYIDFLTSSITEITTNGAGVQGLFESVDISLSMSLSYVYEEYEDTGDEGSVEDVPAPLIGFAGLAMFGLAGLRRKSK